MLFNIGTRRAGIVGRYGPRLAVVVRFIWAIVKGLLSQKYEGGRSASGARQNRCDVGAVEKSESIMNADLVKAASEVITNQQILVNMVSRRVRQLTLGHRPLVECAPGLREADIALTEIANGKLTYESTFGQKENAAPVEVLEFPKVIVAKKAVVKKKAA